MLFLILCLCLSLVSSHLPSGYHNPLQEMDLAMANMDKNIEQYNQNQQQNRFTAEAANAKIFVSGAPPSNDPWKALGDIIESGMECGSIPGVAVIVTKGGWENNAVKYTKTFGYTDVAKNKKAGPNTLWSIGSCTKAFTATLLALQEQQGKLSWNTPVKDILKDWEFRDERYIDSSIDVVDLLSNRVGAQRYDLMWAFDALKNIADTANKTQFISLSSKFRSTFRYNNLHFTLAGHISEKVEGLAGALGWPQLLRLNILYPLKMFNTYPDIKQAYSTGNVPKSYSGKDYPFPDKVNEVLGPVAPAGSIHATIKDMGNWLRFLSSGGKKPDDSPLLNLANLKYTFLGTTALSSQSTFNRFYFDAAYFPQGFSLYSYALGWLVANYRGRQVLWHDGSALGTYSIVAFMPAEKIGFTIVANSDTASTLSLTAMFAAFDIALGDKPWINTTTTCTFPCPWSPSCSAQTTKRATSERTYKVETKHQKRGISSGAPFSDYAGIYSSPAFGTVTVTANATAVNFKYGNFDCVSIAQEWDNFMGSCVTPVVLPIGSRFEYPFRFSRDGGGAVVYFHIYFEDPPAPELRFAKEGTTPSHWEFPRFETTERSV